VIAMLLWQGQYFRRACAEHTGLVFVCDEMEGHTLQVRC